MKHTYRYELVIENLTREDLEAIQEHVSKAEENGGKVTAENLEND